MSTATRNPNADVQKLKDARDKAREKMHDLKAKADEWDLEGMPLGTPRQSAQGDVAARRREKENGPNPHRADHDAAKAAYYELDTQLQALQRDSLQARIEQVLGGTTDYGVRSALETLRDGLNEAAMDRESVRSLIVETPGIDGQALCFDPRFNAWTDFVNDALRTLDAGDLTPPGITEMAAWKLEDR